jgi:hypothetical protein
MDDMDLEGTVDLSELDSLINRGVFEPSPFAIQAEVAERLSEPYVHEPPIGRLVCPFWPWCKSNYGEIKHVVRHLWTKEDKHRNLVALMNLEEKLKAQRAIHEALQEQIQDIELLR